MASSCGKLGIAMSLAALDEMLEIAKREGHNRVEVTKRGVMLAQRENFESIVDDARVCRYCNTTVFLSALTCAHGKTVCLEHTDHLCSKCPSSECLLKYRYTMDELCEMVNKLEERTTHYFEWKDEVDRVLTNPQRKPSLSDVESLLETARQKKFPHTTPLMRLLDISKKCYAAAEKSRTLLNGKVRTRVKTRIQRADTRLNLDGIRLLIAELHALPCDQETLIKELENLVDRIEAWRVEANKIISLCKADHHDVSSDDLRALAERGEDFDVRLDEVDQLWRTLQMRQWSVEAKRVLEWSTPQEFEDSDDFLIHERWKADDVLRLVSEGSRLFANTGSLSLVNRLHSTLKTALLSESKVELLLSDSSANEKDLCALWEEVRQSDWLDSKTMTQLREELIRVRAVRQRMCQREFTLNDILDVIKECRNSKFLIDSDMHKNASALRDNLLKFTQRLLNLFQKPASYYNLVEIIRDRDDLAPLVEGQTPVRYLIDASNPEEQWLQLSEFVTSADMKQHLQALRSQQRTLIGALQLINTQRTVGDTCVCAGAEQHDTELLICLLCRAKYHSTCCEWDSFLDRLPESSYLCVRCLRGRRPCIEDVQAACNIAPQNFLEVVLVRELIYRGREVSCAATSLFSEIVEAVVESVLACEVLDMDVLPKLIPLIQSTCSHILEEQKSAWTLLRNRPARSTPLPYLFLRSKRGKRSSNGRHTRRDRKRSRIIYHQDDEVCSADTCLKPYGDTVEWILCDAGCARWYHYVCIGMTIESAKSLPSYVCYRCSNAPQHVAQHPVAV
ncbi:Rbr-2p [Parelaphostrongylus tenuis]|uniref:Rbr-2p n=1 Tax=Parelaphostrongylus tenuis TaxID=148309 RepID=A0AAD5LX85_PARTN|nr:Rbr-2p [Parelaphostrongylus tenuis]